MENLSACEEQVMVVIWASNEAPDLQTTVKAVNARFGHAWKPQTVSTFVVRLTKKGYLRMERKGRYYFYFSEVSLEEYRKEQMRYMVKQLFNGDKDDAIKCIKECSVKE